MKHLKSYHNIKIGDYIIVTKAYSDGADIKTGDKCKIIKINTFDNPDYFTIKNEKGIIDDYKIDRIIPEIEYHANKFNL